MAKNKEKAYKVVREFTDRFGGRAYKVGDDYIETDPERTKALLEAKKSELNTYGEVYIEEV